MQTSFIRDSPSHWNGSALDIAPDISPSDMQHYAPYKNPKSDPILTKRPVLIKLLEAVPSRIPYLESCRVGIFLETDHIHIGLFTQDGGDHVFYLWGQPKPVYGDTQYRHALPDLPQENGWF